MRKDAGYLEYVHEHKCASWVILIIFKRMERRITKGAPGAVGDAHTVRSDLFQFTHVCF